MGKSLANPVLSVANQVPIPQVNKTFLTNPLFPFKKRVTFLISALLLVLYCHF